MPYTLILGTRYTGAGSSRIRYDYISFYLPPEHLPIRAVRATNGIILAWNGLHLRKTIEARIKDVLESLQS